MIKGSFRANAAKDIDRGAKSFALCGQNELVRDPSRKLYEP